LPIVEVGHDIPDADKPAPKQANVRLLGRHTKMIDIFSDSAGIQAMRVISELENEERAQSGA
jgi:hypothetical protein